MNNLKVKAVYLSSATVALFGIGYFLTYVPAAPSSEEFFARNPHLTRPTPLYFAPEQNRNSDAFLKGDFALISGQAYPVRVEQTVSMSSGEKKLIDFGFDAEITLSSLGVKDRVLTLIADFKYQKVSGGLKLSPDSETLLGLKADKSSSCATCLLVKLDPAGKIKSIYSPAIRLDDASLELKITALNLLFKKLPLLEAGTRINTESDESGLAFPVNYSVTDAGNKSLRIVGKASFASAMGGSLEKTAAAGMPSLGLSSIENDKQQSLTWIWDSEKSLPKTQNFVSSALIKSGSKTLSAYQGDAKTNWKNSVASLFKSEDAERFTETVDFKKFLNRKRAQFSAAKNRKGNSEFRSFSAIKTELQDLAIHPSDSRRDALFLELARSVKEDSSLIEQVKESAMIAAPGSREVSMMLGALGFEGSPAAQSAMIAIYNRPGATLDEQVKVINEFALNAHVLSPETKTFLVGRYEAADPLKSDTASSAALALGASIAHDGDPNTVHYLGSELASAKGILGIHQSKEKQALILTAMGNSKSDAFLAQVKSAADSDDTAIRSAAVNAVRFAQDSASRKLLFHSLRDDSSEEVKTTAAQSLLYQPFDDSTQIELKDCSQSMQPLAVKLECYRVFGMNIQKPGVREFLEARINSESDPQVKRQIIAALSISEDKSSQ